MPGSANNASNVLFDADAPRQDGLPWYVDSPDPDLTGTGRDNESRSMQGNKTMVSVQELTDRRTSPYYPEGRLDMEISVDHPLVSVQKKLHGKKHMNKIAIAAIAMIGFPAMTAAQETVQDGLYRLRTDGGQGTLTVANGRASLGVAGVRPGVCAGGIEGRLTPVEDGVARFSQTQSDLSCTVTVNLDPDGHPLSLVPGTGCTSFHGFSCSFAGEVTGPDVPVSIEAIDAAFNARSPEERRAIQQILHDQGHYNGSIDGVIGVGTRGALIAIGRKDVATDPNVSLGDRPSVTRQLLALLGAKPTVPRTVEDAPDTDVQQPLSEIPFLGTWTCNTPGFDENDIFEFGNDEVTIHMFEMTVTYDGFDAIGDRSNAYAVQLSDGVQLGLFDIASTTMIIMGEGMIYDCRR